MIYGNIDGIKDTVLKQLETIYAIRTPKYQLAAEEILKIMVAVTERIDREISVTLDRKGQVTEVTIGDSTTVSLPIMDVRDNRLSGRRVVHTHPNGSSRLSALDRSALLQMRLDLIAAVAVNGPAATITMAFPAVFEDHLVAEILPEMTWQEALATDVADAIQYRSDQLASAKLEPLPGERALLIGIESQTSLDELAELAEAADIQVSQTVLQHREAPDNAYYFGSGKLLELASLCQITRSNVIIADDELSGSQIKNMEDMTGVKVIDRTTLILEIFSRRARSREAKLQIEAAQLKYRMNRLMGLGLVLSRTGGGIGTRGPGETQLETDRRKIRDRFTDLNRELAAIGKIRHTQRENRFRQELPQVALVGYTNAGKSSLRNALARQAGKEDLKKVDVFAADMLFATLDPTTRAIELPDKRQITLTDTVGFIRKLPHDLVESFKSTLEEVIFADVLIHVVDGSNPEALGQIEAVEVVLTELGAVNKPMILAVNKVDLGLDALLKEGLDRLQTRYRIVATSAETGQGLSDLMAAIGDSLPLSYETLELIIPYGDQKMVHLAHRDGNVLEEAFQEEGTYLKVQLLPALAGKLEKYRVKKDE